MNGIISNAHGYNSLDNPDFFNHEPSGLVSKKVFIPWKGKSIRWSSETVHEFFDELWKDEEESRVNFN